MLLKWWTFKIQSRIYFFSIFNYEYLQTWFVREFILFKNYIRLMTLFSFLLNNIFHFLSIERNLNFVMNQIFN